MTPTSRGRGRPTDLAKRDAILDAARAQFLAKGFEGTTMDAVAATARVSKVTVFNHFGDKVSLLEAVLEREADRMKRRAVGTDGGDDPIAALARCGEALLALLLNPDLLAFDRLLGAEHYRGSDLARRFFAAGPARATAVVADLIVTAADRGTIRVDDPAEAAEELIALWLGATWREEIALGLREIPGDDEVRERVRRAIDRLLRMYGN